jgi:predicted PurR-regulated permease PerM
MDRAVRVIRIIFIILVIVALFLLLIIRLSSLLCVLILSAVVAYLLNKPLRSMEKKMKRPWALLIIFGSLTIITGFFFYYVVPLFVRQAADLIAYTPKLVQAIGGLLDDAGKSAGEPLAGFLKQTFDGFNKRAADWLGSATISLAQGGSSGIGWALLIPVFAFYILKDHEYFIDQVGYLIPLKYRTDLHSLYVSIDKAVGQFLRGQLLVAISVAVMTTTGLLIIGVPNALLLGIICGLCNLIPYIGPLIGAIPVALVSLMLGWKTMLFSVMVVFIVQQVDNMVISPKIMGDSLRIHPVYIIVAIIAGSGLFGFMGLLLALPALIILKEVILFIFKKRLYRNKDTDVSNEKI